MATDGEESPAEGAVEARALRPEERIRAAWPQIRAALVAFHLLAITIAALPSTAGAMNRASWKNPTVQAEIRAWSERAGVPAKRLESRLWSLGMAWTKARAALMAPFHPYIEATATHQSWRMFVAPHRYPERFQIQFKKRGAADSDYKTLFEERSEKHRWKRAFFDHDRIRGALFLHSWPGYGKSAKKTCAWLARRVFAERRDAEEVRCRYYKARSPSPREALARRDPKGKWGREQVIRRSEADDHGARHSKKPGKKRP